jgi:hypothetical protein
MAIPEWNSLWLSPELGGARFDHQRQRLAVVSRAPGNLDVFALGFDDRLWTTFWGEHPISPSITPRLIQVQGEGKFLEIPGKRFTAKTVKIGYDIESGGSPDAHQTNEDLVTANANGEFIHRVRIRFDPHQVSVGATDVASGLMVSTTLQG